MFACPLIMKEKTTCGQKISTFLHGLHFIIDNIFLIIMDLLCPFGWQTIKSSPQNSPMIAEICSAEISGLHFTLGIQNHHAYYVIHDVYYTFRSLLFVPDRGSLASLSNQV